MGGGQLTAVTLMRDPHRVDRHRPPPPTGALPWARGVGGDDLEGVDDVIEGGAYLVHRPELPWGGAPRPYRRWWGRGVADALPPIRTNGGSEELQPP